MAKKLVATFSRNVKAVSKRHPDNPGFTGSQYVFDGGPSGRSAHYYHPDEILAAMPADIRKAHESGQFGKVQAWLGTQELFGAVEFRPKAK